MFPCLHTFALYRIWVAKAFLEPLSFYVRDGALYIDAPDRRRQITLLLRKGDVLKNFLTAATEMGSPSLFTDKSAAIVAYQGRQYTIFLLNAGNSDTNGTSSTRTWTRMGS